ncbi:PREDICTED: N-acetylated-alpha-linked acidic dipeptidase 2-like [Priapulus caudatus]|uniref:N-acetylated-alpha-linked acidic dipeptidase 2-like n=1 Tax=Priapulus caudatus TaxID=37621 RepID=A0ABM1DUF4_PRICU|nr:PREDICTED: N-acetylated-alpha-linked acidic dipeptidase 2-like [Priapulus caudatus]
MGSKTTGALCLLALAAVLIWYRHPHRYFITKPDNAAPAYLAAIAEPDSEWSDKLMKEVNGENIRENLRFLTAKPHLAGTDQSYQLAKHLQRKWLAQGLDWAKLTPYKVLLSYPDTTDPARANKVTIVNRNTKQVEYTTQIEEKPLVSSQDFEHVVPPFNAYSASGNPSGELVYANYATVEDFDYLTKTRRLNLVGDIIIARYGKIYRGDKVLNAEKVGAAGIILFTDPADVALDGWNSVYPDTWWMPPNGVQRGTVRKSSGDPLTPGYPATDDSYRIPQEEAIMPTIPVHPIGYRDAYELLSRISDDRRTAAPPAEWKGGLNISYNIRDTTANWKVEMLITTSNIQKVIYNTIGMIRGSVEPDRYVLVGNHRDAWVFGAIDPSSGTAVLLELSRVLGEMVKQGWRPRRSIVFCSWDGEEYGLIGSTEWVEEHRKTLYDRAVAYINVDIAVKGNYSIAVSAFPSVKQIMYEASKKVPQPKETAICKECKSVYDQWVRASPMEENVNPDQTQPKIGVLGSGSDYDAFAYHVGVPSVDLVYSFNKKTNNISGYPLYHSAYESFHVMNTIIDSSFKHHEAICRLVVEVLRNLAEAVVLPLSVVDHANHLRAALKDFKEEKGPKLVENGVYLDKLEAAVENFTRSANSFKDHVNHIDKKDAMMVRRVNDQLMKFERAFTDSAGLPGRSLTKWRCEHRKTLYDRAVAYINVDIAVKGNYSIAVSAFPSVKQIMYEASKKVPQPRETAICKECKSVYDQWVRASPMEENVNPDQTQPKIGVLGSGSDYDAFAYHVGVPSVDLVYSFNKKTNNISGYPLYHSAYESFHVMNTIIDSSFKHHEAICRLVVEVLRNLAEAVVLPLSVVDHANHLRAALKDFKEEKGPKLAENGVYLDKLEAAVENFTRSANSFKDHVNHVDKKDAMMVRRVNDQLMKFERAFTDSAGLPGRSLTKHLVFAPSKENLYSGANFPGLVDLLSGLDELDIVEKRERLEAIRSHLSVLIHTVRSASAIIREHGDIL